MPGESDAFWAKVEADVSTSAAETERAVLTKAFLGAYSKKHAQLMPEYGREDEIARQHLLEEYLAENGAKREGRLTPENFLTVEKFIESQDLDADDRMNIRSRILDERIAKVVQVRQKLEESLRNIFNPDFNLSSAETQPQDQDTQREKSAEADNKFWEQVEAAVSNRRQRDETRILTDAVRAECARLNIDGEGEDVLLENFLHDNGLQKPGRVHPAEFIRVSMSDALKRDIEAAEKDLQEHGELVKHRLLPDLVSTVTSLQTAIDNAKASLEKSSEDILNSANKLHQVTQALRERQFRRIEKNITDIKTALAGLEKTCEEVADIEHQQRWKAHIKDIGFHLDAIMEGVRSNPIRDVLTTLNSEKRRFVDVKDDIHLNRAAEIVDGLLSHDAKIEFLEALQRNIKIPRPPSVPGFNQFKKAMSVLAEAESNSYPPEEHLKKRYTELNIPGNKPEQILDGCADALRDFMNSKSPSLNRFLLAMAPPPLDQAHDPTHQDIKILRGWEESISIAIKNYPQELKAWVTAQFNNKSGTALSDADRLRRWLTRTREISARTGIAKPKGATALLKEEMQREASISQNIKDFFYRPPKPTPYEPISNSTGEEKEIQPLTSLSTKYKPRSVRLWRGIKKNILKQQDTTFSVTPAVTSTTAPAVISAVTPAAPSADGVSSQKIKLNTEELIAIWEHQKKIGGKKVPDAAAIPVSLAPGEALHIPPSSILCVTLTPRSKKAGSPTPIDEDRVLVILDTDPKPDLKNKSKVTSGTDANANGKKMAYVIIPKSRIQSANIDTRLGRIQAELKGGRTPTSAIEVSALSSARGSRGWSRK